MQFDTGSQNPHFSYFDESDREHQVWYLDAITLYNQIMLAEDAGIDNIMLWRLGSEDPSFWKLISGKHLEEDIKPSELEQFSYGYDIDYE